MQTPVAGNVNFGVNDPSLDITAPLDGNRDSKQQYVSVFPEGETSSLFHLPLSPQKWFSYPDPNEGVTTAVVIFMQIHHQHRTLPDFLTRGEAHPLLTHPGFGTPRVEVQFRPPNVATYPCPCIRLFIRGGMQTPVAGDVNLEVGDPSLDHRATRRQP